MTSVSLRAEHVVCSAVVFCTMQDHEDNIYSPRDECGSQSNRRMPSSLPPDHWQTFAALWTYCPQLTTRGPPPCCRCGDPGAVSQLEATVRKTQPQWRQTLANRTLALHLPGGRQLFVTTGGALWTQQRSSGVCYKRRKKKYFVLSTLDVFQRKCNTQIHIYLPSCWKWKNNSIPFVGFHPYYYIQQLHSFYHFHCMFQ